jgi:lipoprotein signal peptidase
MVEAGSYFFIGIAVVVSIFLIKLILENRHKGEAIAYSLILGGAMGNLIDRVFLTAMLWIPLISIGETGIGRPSTWLILQLSSVLPTFRFQQLVG